jgi:hypothetical protein
LALFLTYFLLRVVEDSHGTTLREKIISCRCITAVNSNIYNKNVIQRTLFRDVRLAVGKKDGLRSQSKLRGV